jgi:hypothetical protein
MVDIMDMREQPGTLPASRHRISGKLRAGLALLGFVLSLCPALGQADSD